MPLSRTLKVAEKVIKMIKCRSLYAEGCTLRRGQRKTFPNSPKDFLKNVICRSLAYRTRRLPSNYSSLE